MNTAILFHDGCNICLSISATFTELMKGNGYRFESINLGKDNTRGKEAAALGVTRLPSLVINGKVLKIDDHSPLEHYMAA